LRREREISYRREEAAGICRVEGEESVMLRKHPEIFVRVPLLLVLNKNSQIHMVETNEAGKDNCVVLS
jgi:hypothetical protein